MIKYKITLKYQCGLIYKVSQGEEATLCIEWKWLSFERKDKGGLMFKKELGGSVRLSLNGED